MKIRIAYISPNNPEGADTHTPYIDYYLTDAWKEDFAFAIKHFREFGFRLQDGALWISPSAIISIENLDAARTFRARAKLKASPHSEG